MRHRFLEAAEVLLSTELPRMQTLANRQGPARILEVTIGILGNLIIHEDPSAQPCQWDSIIELVRAVFFIDDTRCLSEASRLCSLATRKKVRVR